MKSIDVVANALGFVEANKSFAEVSWTETPAARGPVSLDDDEFVALLGRMDDLGFELCHVLVKFVQKDKDDAPVFTLSRDPMDSECFLLLTCD